MNNSDRFQDDISIKLQILELNHKVSIKCEKVHIPGAVKPRIFCKCAKDK